MNSKTAVQSPGYQQAYQAVNEQMANATHYIHNERERLAQANRPQITVLETHQELLWQDHRTLVEQVRTVQNRGQQEDSGARFEIWNLLVATSLVAAAFLIGVTTLEPFDLGWKGWAWCLALALALPFAIDRALQEFRHRAVIRTVILMTISTTLATAFLFGLLRGEVLAQLLDSSPLFVVANLVPEFAPEPDDTQKMTESLRRLWGLAALAFELVAGIAIFDFREHRRTSDSGTLNRLQKELLKVEKQLLEVTYALHEKLAEPARIEAEFWAEFERGLHDGRQQRRMPKWLGMMAVGVLAAASSLNAEVLHVVAATDFSKTSKATTNGSTTEFDANLQAMTMLLANLPANSRVTLVGITDRSYVNPLVFLDAEAGAAGPFSSHLKAARRTLVAEWKRRTASLEATFDETDLLGLFQYAGEAFNGSDATRKVLVVLSDARNYSSELDLETPKRIDVEKTLALVEKQGLLANLEGVEVYVLGAGDHSGKRATAYVKDLRNFWEAFVNKSGGVLKIFSTSRNIDAIESAVAINEGVGEP